MKVSNQHNHGKRSPSRTQSKMGSSTHHRLTMGSFLGFLLFASVDTAFRRRWNPFKKNQVEPNSVALKDAAIRRASIDKLPAPTPLLEMQEYIRQHSDEQLRTELKECKKQFEARRHDSDEARAFDPLKENDCPDLARRKFMIAYYSCPHQAGNRIHHFMNGMFWAMVSNRTLLWHYYDKETCLDIGRSHNPHFCDLVGTNEVCQEILERSDWIASAQEWNHTLSLPPVELAHWWSTHRPPPTDKNGTRIDRRDPFLRKRHPWQEGDEKFAGLDNYTQRVLRIGQQHSWEAAALKHDYERKKMLRTTSAQRRAGDMLSLGLQFVYGMMFESAFNFTAKIRPDPNLVVDSSKVRTIGLHSRHAVSTLDGSDVSSEKKCLHELLNETKGPCSVYIMSDRQITVELLKEYIENVLKCSAIVEESSKTDTSNKSLLAFAEHGANPGEGFWRELALVSSARYGFIGSGRSSSYLLSERMNYWSLLEGSDPPKECYLPNPQHNMSELEMEGQN